jgi:acyl carrier protein
VVCVYPEQQDEGQANDSDCIREDLPVSVDEVDVQAIENKVIEIISEQMGVDKSEISRETSFINDLNADSLDTVELVMEFEDEFDMSIPDEEAEKIQTVGAAIEYIIGIAQSRKKEST